MYLNQPLFDYTKHAAIKFQIFENRHTVNTLLEGNDDLHVIGLEISDKMSESKSKMDKMGHNQSMSCPK